MPSQQKLDLAQSIWVGYQIVPTEKEDDTFAQAFFCPLTAAEQAVVQAQETAFSKRKSETKS
jgi:hypothetical protein